MTRHSITATVFVSAILNSTNNYSRRKMEIIDAKKLHPQNPFKLTTFLKFPAKKDPNVYKHISNGKNYTTIYNISTHTTNIFTLEAHPNLSIISLSFINAFLQSF